MPIKLNDINGLGNGARFFTADLHVHSYGASHDVKDKGMTVEAVVDQAISSGISLLAITDHNSSRNTARSIEYAEKYAGQLLVLAGVEVTTANGHLLVYFAPAALDQLNSFIGRIGVVKPGSQESHTAMSMSDVASVADGLGGVCVAAHIDRAGTGFEMLAPGYPNWKKDIISNRAILGLEVDDPAHLIWYTGDDEPSDAGAERRKLIGDRAKLPGAAARAVLAHLQNSDAHSLRGFAEAQQRRSLTRIKMDSLSFDGFRTALADPEARVRAVSQLPPAVPRVLGMHVGGGFLDTETYRFSDNLTCFIGGRGTGKSTALKCLAYGLGANTEIAEYNNCPDTVVVFCRDAQGIVYRYERMRDSEEPAVLAAEKGKSVDAPPDVFRIEYYGQGHLADVADDPLTHAELFQEFLDRHAHLSDLASRETDLVGQLVQNGARLRPLESQESGRAAKAAEVAACDKKLTLAEEGQLKAIAARKAAIGAEKTLAKALGEIRDGYDAGVSLEELRHDYPAALKAAGALTGDAAAEKRLAAIKTIVDETNEAIAGHELALAKLLKTASTKMGAHLKELLAIHKQLEEATTQQVTDLQKAGLAASLAEHAKVVARRGVVAGELKKLDQKKPELEKLRKERVALLGELEKVRAERSTRRKEQIREVNKHLVKAIDDYLVVVIYEEAGLTADFLRFVKEAMQGQYLQDEQARRLCEATTPQALARLVAASDDKAIAKLAGLGKDWAAKLLERLSPLEMLHELETLAKPPRPFIKVQTKGTPPRQIPVNQLSDGQRHTILLTIAMLAESEVPLVIDQPEDDLDNAFIFSSIVRMLREVKERRQIILVTHNANIAVLGDAELLFPMRREGDGGLAFDRGSIDRSETKRAVQGILEGGELAFLRRKEIYGH